ncbi:hypothetical protein LNP26_01960 [Klebsiella variicola subsp. variicola]|nr:hypothetical protein [Klebsiella variicola subsp. variicola]
MYRGEAVETGSVEEIFRSPQHPYTQSLLAAVPRLGRCGVRICRAVFRFPVPAAGGDRNARHGGGGGAYPAGARPGGPFSGARWAAQSRDARSACGGEDQF